MVITPRGEAAPGTRSSDILDTAIVIGFCALLSFGPLAFGAVEEWSILVLESATCVLFLLWTLRQVLVGELLISNPLVGPMLLFGSVVGAQLLLHRSAYMHDTASAAQLYVLYAALAVLAMNTLREAHHEQIFWMGLTGFGFLLAVFAIMQNVSPNGAIYWTFEPHQSASFFGPYVNRNHYAGLMEMLIPIPVIMSFRHDLSPSQRVLLGFAALIMASSLVLSGSRGGFIAFAAEVALVIVIVATRNRRSILPIAICALLGLGLVAWIGHSEVFERLGTIATPMKEGVTATRWAIVKDSVNMIAARPVLGWGLGTFPTVYPQFRTFYTELFVNQAHNDYLQWLAETGIVGLGAMVWLLATVFIRASRKIRGWHWSPGRALTLAAIIGVAGLAVHSFVDFNFEIPANAALFFTLCGVAVRHSTRNERAGTPEL